MRAGARLLALAGAVLSIALLPTAPAAAASYPASVKQSVFVTMDDGVHLAGSLYFPSRDGKTVAPGRFPVVLTMTPYGRNLGQTRADWAQRGYVGAIFDIRGAGGSEGNLNDNYFSPRESRDSAEVIDYLGTRPYSNGRVGMIGGSYEGITQLLAAARQPRHLKAIVPTVPLADLYRDAVYHGGILSEFFGAQYLAVQGAPGLVGGNDPGDAPHTILAKFDQAQSKPIAFDYLESNLDGPFFRARSPVEQASRIKVPMLLYAGWFDGLSARGGPEMWGALRRRRGVETRIVIDPITHKGNGPPFNLSGYDPKIDDFAKAQQEFLAHYLEGKPEAKHKPVKLFLMGRDKYVYGSTIPLAGTRDERLFLKAGTTSPAPVASGRQSYFTNPSAGFSVTFDRHGTVAASPYMPLDQRTENEEGLVWSSKPLESPLAVAGPISMRLVASSTANNTDWYVRISDVRPDGSTLLLTPGYLRASFRALDPRKSTPLRPYHPHKSTSPITPGKKVTYAIEVWPTANEFEKGHRIRIQLASEDVPNHMPGTLHLDRSNPANDSFTPLPPATNTVYFGGAGGTSLLLPVIRGSVPRALGGCLARRAPIGRRNIGRIRLRYTRSRLLRIPIRPTRQTKRVYRYCVKRSHGRVSAVLSARGRAVLVTTTATGHRLRGVGRGVSVRRLRARFPHRRRLARGLYRAGPHSRRVFGVRGGKVRWVVVAERSLLVRPKLLRRYLRRAGL